MGFPPLTHPTHYSLFPIPCSLFPIPCSLLPTPYSLLPTPNDYLTNWGMTSAAVNRP
ncbi:MAG: hypothetical protein F6K56_07835 [Moorea sp. SIO3G5]|nr:hypothetical protein [Moorena sp. SIO3G5]